MDDNDVKFLKGLVITILVAIGFGLRTRYRSKLRELWGHLDGARGVH